MKTSPFNRYEKSIFSQFSSIQQLVYKEFGCVESSTTQKTIAALEIAVLGAPILPCAVLGLGFCCLKNSAIRPIKLVGYLGDKIMIPITIISSVPLAVYVIAKAIFATFLNTVTKQKFKSFRGLEELSCNIVVISAQLIRFSYQLDGSKLRQLFHRMPQKQPV